MPIFENEQWVVEDDVMGPVATMDPYDIDLERVFETTERGHRTFYDWPVHMAEKKWVNARLFNQAFDHAIRHYAQVSGEPIDEPMLAESYREARRISRERW
jgi:hypothetical protein